MFNLANISLIKRLAFLILLFLFSLAFLAAIAINSSIEASKSLESLQNDLMLPRQQLAEVDEQVRWIFNNSAQVISGFVSYPSAN